MRHYSGPISCRSYSAAAAWAVGRSRARRRVRGASAAGRFLHRHFGVHRLQRVRGGVQGMARGARRRVQPARDVVRQHGHAGRETWRHVALIERTGGDGRVSDQTDRTRWRRVGHDARRNGHPEVRAPPGRRHRRRVPNRLPVADELRYVQAPHAREVSGRVPDGRVVPHRVRHCRCAARNLQWMRLLRVGLLVWGDRPRRG